MRMTTVVLMGLFLDQRSASSASILLAPELVFRGKRAFRNR